MRVQSWFWKPADLLREHSDRDFGAGNLRYSEWHAAGHLKVSPGKSIDPAVITLFIAELRYRMRGHGPAIVTIIDRNRTSGVA
jgi:hypothetical protein